MIGRRALFGWLGSCWASHAVVACRGCRGGGGSDRQPAPASTPPARATASEPSPSSVAASWREIDFAPSDDYREAERAAVLARDGDAPLLIALHGAGEAAKGLAGGSRGWRDDYYLDSGEQRLRQPPLTHEDFLGFVRSERLAQLNASLAERPYAGLSLACPFTPRIQDPAAARPFASFIVTQLLPRVRAETGAPGNAKVGIDGVSMGGRLALLVGLSHPEHFDAVGALQPAIAVHEAAFFSELARRALSKKALPLRIVSSDDDSFREAVLALSERMTKDGVAHRLLVTPGPHDYAWNRGPGSIEMLLWHDRVLRGHPSP